MEKSEAMKRGIAVHAAVEDYYTGGVSRLHVKRCPTGGWDAWHNGIHVAWAATRQEAFNIAIGRK